MIINIEKEIKINKDEEKINIGGTPKPSRRSITSYDLNKYNIKLKAKEDSYFNTKKIPKKKDSNTLIRNNILLKQGNINNSINSKREMSKIENNNKVYPIIEQNKNMYLSQQLKNKSNNEIFLNEKDEILNQNKIKKDKMINEKSEYKTLAILGKGII